MNIKASKILQSLEQSGMEVVGVILDKSKKANGTHQRAIVDNFGRVQWWQFDGDGRMVAICDELNNLKGGLNEHP